MSKKCPHIAPIESMEPLILTPWPNGGWTISARSMFRDEMSRQVGSFSSGDEMIRALDNALGAAKHAVPQEDGGQANG